MKIVPAKPVMGDEYRLITEESSLKYRGKEYPYIHHCYEEISTGDRYTTTDLDRVNISQIYNQYRAENGIPYADEIQALRRYYDLSLTLISKILGFGSNQYGLYESGEVPNLSNGKLLKSVMLSPEAFGKLADDLGEELPDKVREKIHQKVAEALRNEENEWYSKRVFGKSHRDKYNGYAPQSLQVVHNTILYFISNLGATFKTQMNKLLFYADFLSYKRYGMGITGLTYVAIQYGPVPRNWDKVYSAFDDIHPEIVAVSKEILGERLNSDIECKSEFFTDEQLNILSEVCSTFCNMSSRELSKLSHTEQAWLKNIDSNAPIDYTYAFSLKGI